MKRHFILIPILLIFVFSNLSFVNAQSNTKMKKALILIDIQNDYFPGGKMALWQPLPASKNAARILDYFRQNNLPVVHVQHDAGENGSFFASNSEGFKTHKGVAAIEGEKGIIKHYPNSFRETDLLEFLKNENITDLVICGMMTHMCIDASVRAAKDFGYNIELIGDACTTKDLEINGEKMNAEEVHLSFLAALNGYYSVVINTDQFLAK